MLAFAKDPVFFFFWGGGGEILFFKFKLWFEFES